MAFTSYKPSLPVTQPSPAPPSFTPYSADMPVPAAPVQQQSSGPSFLDAANGVLGAIEKPFVDVAATPLQAGVAALNKITGKNIPDPFAGGVPTPIPNAATVPVSPLSKPLQKLGSAAEIGTYFIPYGRFATLGTLGRLGAGTAAGYGTDVASNLAEGKTGADALKPGLGTALGAVLPGAAPAAKLAGRAAGETVGVTTGTGYGVIRQAYDAAKQGGDAEKAFTTALRGQVSPDQIVQEARDSLGTVIDQRRANYQGLLANIAQDKKSLDISPINDALQNQLKNFKITIGKDGLDFSRSSIRFDPAAQGDVNTIYNEMKGFGSVAGDRTAIGVDNLKQALSDLYSKSSNVRALVANVRGATRSVLSQVHGYDQLTKDYADKTDLISEIQRGLSLGDKASVDTSFKKLTSALRLNNDFRKEMIQELDNASGGQLSSKVAGQQMSELLPRGVMRPLEGAGAIGAAATGFFVPLLKFAAFASPRIVGEMINALGLSSHAADRALQAIGGLSTLQTAATPAVQAVKNQPLPVTQ